jgi:hypothetical protein
MPVETLHVRSLQALTPSVLVYGVHRCQIKTVGVQGIAPFLMYSTKAKTAVSNYGILGILRKSKIRY